VGAGEVHDIFAAEPERIIKIQVVQGQEVAAGDKLFELSSTELDYKLRQRKAKAESLDQSINRQLTGVAYHQGLNVTENELAQLHSEISGLKARRAKLLMRAPAAGRVVMVDNMLRTNMWVRADRPLAQIVAATSPILNGYGEERDIGFIEIGARMRLILEGRPDDALHGKVHAIYPKAITKLDEPMLAVPAGGPIDVRPYRNELVPILAIYKIKLNLDSDDRAKLPMIKTRGVAIIDTPPRNLIGRIKDRLIGMWRREFG